jgi:hypothetical protein
MNDYSEFATRHYVDEQLSYLHGILTGFDDRFKALQSATQPQGEETFEQWFKKEWTSVYNKYHDEYLIKAGRASKK